MRNQCGKPERQSSHVSLLFVFHVFGSLVRNQCVTSAGISQQCGTSAEPVRNESHVDISGFKIVSLYIFAISAQPVRNQCGEFHSIVFCALFVKAIQMLQTVVHSCVIGAEWCCSAHPALVPVRDPDQPEHKYH